VANGLEVKEEKGTATGQREINGKKSCRTNKNKKRSSQIPTTTSTTLC
jgi:hypothetical protein